MHGASNRRSLPENTNAVITHSPGRFFAVNELKAMMAYLLLNYDVKMENEGVRPKDSFKGTRTYPDPVAEVLFKKRKN